MSRDDHDDGPFEWWRNERRAEPVIYDYAPDGDTYRVTVEWEGAEHHAGHFEQISADPRAFYTRPLHGLNLTFPTKAQAARDVANYFRNELIRRSVPPGARDMYRVNDNGRVVPVRPMSERQRLALAELETVLADDE